MKRSQLAELADDADRCVRCGLCIPLCPTWQVTRNEGQSPRGRIVAMARLADGEKPDGAAAMLDSCLGCGVCQQACPSDVPYLRMIGVAKRAAGGKNHPLVTLLARLAAASHGDLILRMLLAAGRIAARLPGIGRRSDLIGMLPRPNRARQATIAAASTSDGPPVVLFRGFGNSLDQAEQGAASQLLAACGYRIVSAPKATCCGSLLEHAAQIDAAKKAAAQNRAAFPAGAAVATTASGCAAGLNAQHPAMPAIDACQLVLNRIERLPAAQPAKRPVRIILHIPCTGQAAAGATGLLEQIPAAQVIETGAGQCCGAGGITCINHRRQGRALAEPLAEAIIAAADQHTLIACPNHPCARHIERALADKGQPQLVRHPLEIFAEQWFGPQLP
ncbi:MAG: (Fe-S)-binding protein [Betaproteobacteria bacterium]|nr:(Fe-S)-binding protein [Betaproteobacteria bacterium]